MGEAVRAGARPPGWGLTTQVAATEPLPQGEGEAEKRPAGRTAERPLRGLVGTQPRPLRRPRPGRWTPPGGLASGGAVTTARPGALAPLRRGETGATRSGQGWDVSRRSVPAVARDTPGHLGGTSALCLASAGWTEAPGSRGQRWGRVCVGTSEQDALGLQEARQSHARLGLCWPPREKWLPGRPHGHRAGPPGR